ncbi:hypothetical protein BC835DRAFT_105227 [Cytidiella melzeri]|nr:hypothetical protein BC835DRAFT_105227 [Cytidiella melzeri]
MSNVPESQVLTIPAAPRPAPLYPFLSHPPQKKRPTQPLPPPPTQVPSSPVRPPVGRLRSATVSAVSAWVAEVHPGSPAPYSPRRSPSIGLTSRRSSFSRTSSRRVSAGSTRVPSASFMSFSDTPTTGSRLIITPSIKDFEPDLTAMGYTSVFVHFPTTPLSPPINHRVNTSSRVVPSAAPASPVKQTQLGLKHLKSLSSLKPGKRARSKAPPSPPAVPIKSPAEVKRLRALQSAAVARCKKSKYAKLRPAPLANDLALAQLMDGGKLDDHVKQYTKIQAKANGAMKVDGQVVGVGDVYRDEEGGVWMDQDEVWEFAHLLGGDEDFCMDEVEWVEFGSPTGKENQLLDLGCRQSLSTQDSDLSPRYAMKVEADSHDDLAGFGAAIVPTTLIKPGLTVLALPARSRRTAKHLRKPEFLLDVFPLPRSPTKSCHAPSTPRSPRAFPVSARAKGKARRRPTPLNLSPPSPAFKRPLNPADPDQMRTEFLQDSFRPRPRRARQGLQPMTPATAVIPAPAAAEAAPRKILTTKASIANMKGFLKAIGGKKSAAA